MNNALSEAQSSMITQAALAEQVQKRANQLNGALQTAIITAETKTNTATAMNNMNKPKEELPHVPPFWPEVDPYPHVPPFITEDAADTQQIAQQVRQQSDS